jgi:hypothetical protein
MITVTFNRLVVAVQELADVNECISPRSCGCCIWMPELHQMT